MSTLSAGKSPEDKLLAVRLSSWPLRSPASSPPPAPRPPSPLSPPLHDVIISCCLIFQSLTPQYLKPMSSPSRADSFLPLSPTPPHPRKHYATPLIPFPRTQSLLPPLPHSQPLLTATLKTSPSLPTPSYPPFLTPKPRSPLKTSPPNSQGLSDSTISGEDFHGRPLRLSPLN